MKAFFTLWALLAALVFLGAAPQTTLDIQVTNPSGARVTPVAADSLADMVGTDTHLGANIPYTTVGGTYASGSNGTNILNLLEGSNFRHIRDGSGPNTGPVHGSIALQVDALNPYCNGNCHQTETGVQQLHDANPNADYWELCGNEQDSRTARSSTWKTSNTNNAYGTNSEWAVGLANCVATEANWIHSLYPNDTRPIVGPSLISETGSAVGLAGEVDGAEFAAALGSNKSLLSYDNIHYGVGGENPLTTINANPVTAATYARLVTPQFFVTEWSYDDQEFPTISSNAPIYARPNSIAPAYIAAYDLRAFFMWKSLGAARVYIYQFADVPTDCEFGGDGLVRSELTGPSGIFTNGLQNDAGCSKGEYGSNNANGYRFSGVITKKPEYNAVNNFIALFSDPGSTFTPAPISASITTSTNAKSFVAENRAGRVFVAAWREETDWNDGLVAECPLGNAYHPAAPPFANQSTPCETTTESASVSLPGYTLVRKDTLQADGSFAYATTGLSGNLVLNTGYPVILEYTPG